MIHTSALVRITKASCHRHGYAVAALGEVGLIKASVKGILSHYARACFLSHCAALRKSASLPSCSALTANPPTANKTSARTLCAAHGFCLRVDALRAMVMTCLQVAVAVLGR